MIVRGKELTIQRHAFEGMRAERPSIRLEDVAFVLETPGQDDGHQAWAWVGHRTVLVYYREDSDEIYVHSVSASRRRFPTHLP